MVLTPEKHGPMSNIGTSWSSWAKL